MPLGVRTFLMRSTESGKMKPREIRDRKNSRNEKKGFKESGGQ